MFGNTLSLTVDGAGPLTLVKINQDGYSSEYLYKGTTIELTVRIRHSKTKATAGRPAYDRHNVEIVRTTYATETTPEYTTKVYIVKEHPPNVAEKELTDALADWLIASSNANVVSLNNWES